MLPEPELLRARPTATPPREPSQDTQTDDSRLAKRSQHHKRPRGGTHDRPRAKLRGADRRRPPRPNPRRPSNPAAPTPPTPAPRHLPPRHSHKPQQPPHP